MHPDDPGAHRRRPPLHAPLADVDPFRVVCAQAVTIQDLGSIGELVAAAATVATLAYLAIQVRQNTRALRSSTFQQISMDMSLLAGTIAGDPDLAAIIVKAS